MQILLVIGDPDSRLEFPGTAFWSSHSRFADNAEVMITTTRAAYSKSDAPNIAKQLGNEEFQYVLIAARLADKHGRFDRNAVGRETGRYYRDVQETEWHLKSRGILESCEGRIGELTEDFGRAVGKEVRRLWVKQKGLPDPEQKPGFFVRVGRTIAEDSHKIFIDVVKVVIGGIAVAATCWFLKRYGFDPRQWK